MQRNQPTDHDHGYGSFGELRDSDAQELRVLGEELSSQRPPLPETKFAELRELVERTSPRGRPARLHLLVASYSVSGAILLIAAGLSLTGAGPLAH